jgi:hypothetical protein
MTKLIVLLLFFVGATSCSSSAERKDEDKSLDVSEPQTLSVQESPDVLLAIIQDGYNPPNKETINRFKNILQTVNLAYPTIDTGDVADKIAKAYDLARERGYKDSFVEFAEGFSLGVQNSIDNDSIYVFDQFLVAYICYQVNCDGGKLEVRKSDAVNKEISKLQYKELWPFTVDQGTLRCIQIKVSTLTVHAIVFEANGKNYAINGTAKNWAKENGYSNSDEILNSSVPIGQIIADGLKLCE